MHVYNPVDWYPWGPEAFEKAKREDKPIFLSVGYSTCYWCHVMEREVFSNPEIAKLMNASFVSVKVDREERPDIDEIYMQATHLLTRSGGWPNSVFLTPNGKPFFAGTYFPPEDRGGRPGFPSILNRLSSRWNTERDQVLARAERVAAAIQAGFGRTDPVGASFDPMQLLARGVDGLAGRFDAIEFDAIRQYLDRGGSVFMCVGDGHGGQRAAVRIDDAAVQVAREPALLDADPAVLEVLGDILDLDALKEERRKPIQHPWLEYRTETNQVG